MDDMADLTRNLGYNFSHNPYGLTISLNKLSDLMVSAQRCRRMEQDLLSLSTPIENGGANPCLNPLNEMECEILALLWLVPSEWLNTFDEDEVFPCSSNTGLRRYNISNGSVALDQAGTQVLIHTLLVTLKAVENFLSKTDFSSPIDRERVYALDFVVVNLVNLLNRLLSGSAVSQQVLPLQKIAALKIKSMPEWAQKLF